MTMYVSGAHAAAHGRRRRPSRLARSAVAGASLLAASAAWASGEGPDLTGHWIGYLCIAIFVLAYALVIGEENLHLRKSKPVIVAAGVIWALVAIVLEMHGDSHSARAALTHNILEYGELFLFLLAAMTYINAMEERGVFDALRGWLISRGFSLRAIYWITGALAFFISPVADNLTTALLMVTVVMSVGAGERRFVTVACINIVVAANAGGAFSPFGDITTLMVWQKGILGFGDFFQLFIPSVVNWVVPAALMVFTVPKAQPEPLQAEVSVKRGAWVIAGMFMLTIVMAVSSHNFLHMPPVLGMTTGLGLLKVFGYFLERRELVEPAPAGISLGEHGLALENMLAPPATSTAFNVFKALERAEWDTLMFFYGIILCVGGLGTLGYLSLLSQVIYVDLGATIANVSVGFLSALVDNIPVMFAVLSMFPQMDPGQWLLVTLTAGVGGSLLSIGSAAGVAVMGQARGVYTFSAHLKWTWAILVGYGASVWTHFLINAGTFA
jgi:Na+/H+ antiporter NhaD/arsenite permease-like protein